VVNFGSIALFHNTLSCSFLDRPTVSIIALFDLLRLRYCINFKTVELLQLTLEYNASIHLLLLFGMPLRPPLPPRPVKRIGIQFENITNNEIVHQVR
jgi:hypothetical protein